MRAKAASPRDRTVIGRAGLIQPWVECELAVIEIDRGTKSNPPHEPLEFAGVVLVRAAKPSLRRYGSDGCSRQKTYAPNHELVRASMHAPIR